MTTTTIGLLSAPETSATVTTSPYHPKGFAHALLIDLSACEDLPGGVRDPITLSDAEKHAAYKLFLERLRMIVKEDGEKHPPIDMVRFDTTNYTEGPSTHTYRALDGLRPRHAEFLCGQLEGCEMRYLDLLKTPWPLESLLVSGLLEDSGMFGDGGVFPAACRSLKALTFSYCCDIQYGFPSYMESLRYLKIEENNASGMFVDICKLHPGVETRLSTLVICEERPMDFTSRPFKDLLKRCTSLTSLEIYVGPMYSIEEVNREWEDGAVDGLDEPEAEDSDEDSASMEDEFVENEPVENEPAENDLVENEPDDDRTDRVLEDSSEEGIEYPRIRLSRYPKHDPWHGKEFPEEYVEPDWSSLVPVYKVIALSESDPSPAPETIWHQLYQNLPPNLEHFRFRGPPHMVGELSKWLEAARDERWLPRLKTFSFCLEYMGDEPLISDKAYSEVAASASTEIEVKKFLDALAESRPTIKIVE